MRRTRSWLLGLVLGAALLGALPIGAQLPEMPPGKWWKRPRVVEQLGLQPDQQERLDEIFSKNRRAFIDLRAEVERRQLDLEELLAKRDADPKRVAAASEALEQARARLGKARTMLVVEMRGVLTDQQWQKILEARDRWKAERMEEFRENRKGQRRGPRPDAEPPQ